MEKILTMGIAVYNIKEDYLRACLDSVLQNSGDTLEILIIDDGSKTECAALCRRYQQKDKRVRYIRNEKNMGICAVRNRMISEANGKWISFVDGDDAVSNTFLESLAPVFSSDYDVVRFKHASFTDKIPNIDKEKGDLLPLDEDLVQKIGISAAVRYRVYDDKMLLDLNISESLVTTAVYRRGFLLQNGCRFDENLKAAEDSLFNAFVCAQNPKYAVFAKTLYYYRSNPYSVTKKFNENIKSVTDAYLAIIRQFLDKTYPNDKNIILNFYRYRCGLALINNFEQNIFNPNNKKPVKQRKNEFLKLIAEEPYQTALAAADGMNGHKRRLLLKLAAKKRFFAIWVAYRCPAVFKIYGGICRRTEEKRWKKQ